MGLASGLSVGMLTFDRTTRSNAVLRLEAARLIQIK
jgi:hypothetical protein